jgi:hypothetical protein
MAMQKLWHNAQYFLHELAALDQNYKIAEQTFVYATILVET